jgi:hypothetical protein
LFSVFTKAAMSPSNAKCTVPYFAYSVIRGSARRMISRARCSACSAGGFFVANQLSTAGFLFKSRA